MLAKTELDKTRRGLLKAAQHIKDIGWWDGKPDNRRNPHDRACIVQALNDVSSSYLHYLDMVRLVKPRCYPLSVPEWNDSHTEQEVLDLLHDVAYDI